MDFDNYLLSDKQIDTLETPERLAKRLYSVGTKFNIMGDDNFWYVIGYIDDDIKYKNNEYKTVIVTKSCNNSSNQWNYKTQEIWKFLMEQYYMTFGPSEKLKTKKVPLRDEIDAIENVLKYID